MASEKGPRQFTIQDYLGMVGNFTFNVSSDEDEIEARKALAGQDIVIHEDQAAGTEVGVATLDRLEDEGDRIEWARFGLAVPMVNTALHLLRLTEPKQYRNFKLVRVFDDKTGQPIPADEIHGATIGGLGHLEQAAKDFEISKKAGKLTKKQIKDLGRGYGRTSVRLSMFGFDGYEDQDEADVMEEIKALAINMHQDVKTVTKRIGADPTIAQLRSPFSEFGNDIVTSRIFSPRVVKTFKDTARELGQDKGY
jgi:hypothetical protein